MTYIFSKKVNKHQHFLWECIIPRNSILEILNIKNDEIQEYFFWEQNFRTTKFWNV